MNAKEFFKGLIDTIYSRDCVHGFIGMVIPAMCLNGVLKQSSYSIPLLCIAIFIAMLSIIFGVICDIQKYKPETRKLRLYIYFVHTMSHLLMIAMCLVTFRAFESGDYSLFIMTITFSLLALGLQEDYQNKIKETR